MKIIYNERVYLDFRSIATLNINNITEIADSCKNPLLIKIAFSMFYFSPRYFYPVIEIDSGKIITTVSRNAIKIIKYCYSVAKSLTIFLKYSYYENISDDNSLRYEISLMPKLTGIKLICQNDNNANLNGKNANFEEWLEGIKTFQEATQHLKEVYIDGSGIFLLPEAPLPRLNAFIERAKALLKLFPKYNPLASTILTKELRGYLTDSQLLSLKPEQEPLSLDFSNLSQISARGMVEFLHGFSSIQINFTGCDRMLQDMQDDSLLSMEEILDLEKLRQGYSPLLSSPDYIKMLSRMSDQDLIKLFQTGKIDPNTCMLDLKNMSHLTLEGFKFILEKLLKIDELILGNANVHLYLQHPQLHLRILKIPLEVSQTDCFSALIEKFKSSPIKNKDLFLHCSSLQPTTLLKVAENLCEESIYFQTTFIADQISFIMRPQATSFLTLSEPILKALLLKKEEEQFKSFIPLAEKLTTCLELDLEHFQPIEAEQILTLLSQKLSNAKIELLSLKINLEMLNPQMSFDGLKQFNQLQFFHLHSDSINDFAIFVQHFRESSLLKLLQTLDLEWTLHRMGLDDRDPLEEESTQINSYLKRIQTLEQLLPHFNWLFSASAITRKFKDEHLSQLSIRRVPRGWTYSTFVMPLISLAGTAAFLRQLSSPCWIRIDEDTQVLRDQKNQTAPIDDFLMIEILNIFPSGILSDENYPYRELLEDHHICRLVEAKKIPSTQTIKFGNMPKITEKSLIVLKKEITRFDLRHASPSLYQKLSKLPPIFFNLINLDLSFEEYAQSGISYEKFDETIKMFCTCQSFAKHFDKAKDLLSKGLHFFFGNQFILYLDQNRPTIKLMGNLTSEENQFLASLENVLGNFSHLNLEDLCKIEDSWPDFLPLIPERFNAIHKLTLGLNFNFMALNAEYFEPLAALKSFKNLQTLVLKSKADQDFESFFNYLKDSSLIPHLQSLEQTILLDEMGLFTGISQAGAAFTDTFIERVQAYQKLLPTAFPVIPFGIRRHLSDDHLLSIKPAKWTSPALDLSGFALRAGINGSSADSAFANQVTSFTYERQLD